MAEAQHGGRGQGQNVWHSESGKNLTFSIILNCSFLPPSGQFYLNMAISLGIIEGLAAHLEAAGSSRKTAGFQISPPLPMALCIKWPNDIYAGKNKLGGILIENMLAGPILKTSVAGIGINVNQEHFPGLDQATSLKREVKREFSRKELLRSLCSFIEARYLQLKGGARDALKSAYLAHLLAYNQQQLFRAGPEQFEGTITGVSPEGRLLVMTAGQVRSFDKKEIRFIF